MMFIATGFFIGRAPLAPGTLGSFLGLGVCFLLSRATLPLAVVFTVVLVAIAIWSSHETERHLKLKDPGCIVIDEVAGMAVTLLGLPFGFKTAIAGFIVFRILDIWKPFPIRYLESHAKGGIGIVVDDLAAGLAGNLIVRWLLMVPGLAG